MPHRLNLLAVAFALSLLSQPIAAEDVVVVETKDYKFDPVELTVKVGTRVRWVNLEKRQYHSVYFPDLDEEQGDYFFPDEARERVFDTPGTYKYYCEPHAESHDMVGVVHVVE